ncbi:MAG: type II/IV secretion system ATPase subunit [Methanomassiliicoccus sp.]|nr:type II/IV secretion system ATPase subunit [Methanomassiliicoccus sp.]
MTARVMVRAPRTRMERDDGVGRALSKIFRERAMRRPGFSGCWVATSLPGEHQVLESYEVSGAKVTIASSQGGGLIYHAMPWEYGLQDAWVSALSKVIRSIAFLPPPTLSTSLDDLRSHVSTTSARLLRNMSSAGQVDLGKGIEEREANVGRLSEVVARYTVGLGLFEVLLSDNRIEDVYVDAPSGENPIHVTLNGVSGTNAVCRCMTNITVSEEEVDKLASRLRQSSGRPFSEAFPIMETDVEGHDSRATVIGPPLSPGGTAVALRRHSRTPWTLLKLAANGSIDASTAGLLSFLMDGRSTMLICGARGAGKSSLLSAMMFEFPLSQRILAIEDTLELPTRQMQSLGYKVQSLFVESRMDRTTEEMAEQALRVSLRLGESAIVLGEVRGKEAQTLYQSMRAGRAGSSVLGTIHGDSAASVYERVVHDMGIPKEAFLATDLVLTMGLYRPGGASRSVRRLVEVAECRRRDQGVGFHQLLGDDVRSALMGSEIVARIASSWNITMSEAVDNIQARADMRQALLDAAAADGPRFLEPDWVFRCNDFFWDRMDAGDRDYASIAADFRSYVQGRCGHVLA